MNKSCFILPLTLLVGGCWTFNESSFPEVAFTSPAAECTVAVTGFEAYQTEYEAVQSVRTVYVPGYISRHYYEPGYYETVPAVSYLPRTRATDMYLRRAQDELERAGFTLAQNNASRTVDVSFAGPVDDSGDSVRRACWMIGTVFFCDYGAETWTARLRIRDPKSGKLLFSRDYTQKYETNVFALIPLFGPAGCDRTDSQSMRAWCMTALTDRAVADATAFLATGK